MIKHRVQDLPHDVLGRLIVESVERSLDPSTGEVHVFRFLSALYRSARERERAAAEGGLRSALLAVERAEEGVERQRASSAEPPRRGPPTPTRSTSLPPKNSVDV